MKEPSVTRATAPRPVTITEAADYKGKVDFAILTIRDDEFQAVLDRFPPFTRVSGRRIYNLHHLDLPAGESYLVAVLKCIEQGNTEALDAARDVLEELEPRWTLLVGIAGGVPSDELTLGDVVVSNRIVDFSVEAILQDKASEYALGGGPIHKDAATILANLRALAPELRGWSSAASIGAPRPPVEIDDGEFYGDDAWQKKARAGLARQAARTEPIVTAGAVGSSDRLVKDTKILATFLLKAARQVLAVEMESAGVYRATTGRGVPLVAIRGLSDVVGFKRDPGWTAYACHSAAAFTKAFLLTKPIKPKASTPTRTRYSASEGAMTTELNEAIEDLKAAAEDVQNAGYREAPDAIRRLVHILDEPPLAAAIQSLPDVDLAGCLAAAELTGGSMIGSGHLSWPTNTRERIAMQLALLRAIANGEVEVTGLTMNFFHVSNNFNANYYSLVEKMVAPFLRDLSRMLHKFLAEHTEERVQEQPPVPTVTHHYQVSGPVGVIQSGTGNSASVIQNVAVGDSVVRALAELRQASEYLDGDDREEAIEAVDTIEAEVKSPKPKKSIIRQCGAALNEKLKLQPIDVVALTTLIMNAYNAFPK